MTLRKFVLNRTVPMPAVLLLALALVLAPSVRLAAQTPRVAVTPYGLSIASVGDLDGDGVGDLLASAPFTSSTAAPTGSPAYGSVAALSGADGRILFAYDSSTQPVSVKTQFPGVSACGDVDGDGTPDFALNTAFSAVTIVSGATGAPIRELVGQVHDGIGDADGDGIPDFATGADGVLRIFSGADGALLHEIAVPVSGSPADPIAVLSRAGDIDGDGRGDVVIRGGSYDAESDTTAFELRIYSGATGALLLDNVQTVPYFSTLIHAPGDVVPAGDRNGDATGDLLLAMPFGDPSVEGLVMSGRDGAVLASFDGPVLAHGAAAATVLGDVDRDGVADVAFASTSGSPTDFSGRVVIFSGASGAVLSTIAGPDPVMGFGVSLRATGDLDGDGRPDFVVGTSQGAPVPHYGLLVYSLPGKPAEVWGHCWSGAAWLISPTLSLAGPLEGDTAATARVANGDPGAAVLLIAGQQLAAGGGVPTSDVLVPLALDGSGNAALTVRWPAGVPSGFTLYVRMLGAKSPIGPGDHAEWSNLLRLTAP